VTKVVTIDGLFSKNTEPVEPNRHSTFMAYNLLVKH
jgi:hypothetical protein